MDSKDKPEQKGTGAAGRAVLRAAGIVAVAFLLGRFLGLGREILIRAFFGIGSIEAQAYALANRLPDFIFNVIAGGALASAYVPTFTATFSEDESRAWDLFSSIVNLLLLVLAIVALLIAWFAEPLLVAFYFSPEMLQDPELLELTVRMTRVMLGSTVIFGASGVLMGTLNARQRFLAPALAVSMYNIGIMVGVLIWNPSGMGMAYGAVIGAFAHLAIQLPAMRQIQARYRLLWDWGMPEVGRILILMGPRVLGLSFSYLNRFVMPALTRPLAAGSLPALDNALQLMLMPYSILGQAMGTAAFPTLAALASEKDWDGLKAIIVTTIRSTLFLGLPIAVGMALLRRPIVVVLFQRGEFDAAATDLVSAALFFYLLALIALALLEIISRSFYAMEDTVTPVVASLLQLPLMAAFGAWFAYRIFPIWGLPPLGGLALGFSVSNWIEVVLLLVLLRRRIGPLNPGRWGIGPMLLAVTLMGGAVWVGQQSFGPLPHLIELALYGAIGAGIYGGASYALGIPEMRQLTGMILRRLGR